MSGIKTQWLYVRYKKLSDVRGVNLRSLVYALKYSLFAAIVLLLEIQLLLFFGLPVRMFLECQQNQLQSDI